ncbi:MAG: hypothetical protein ACRD0U_04280 [Acidimicrobiales bacterium]
MPYDDDRRHLADRLEGVLGDRAATTLMSHLPPVPWTELATRSDITGVRGEIAELRGEVREFRGEMREFKGEVRGEMSELRGEMAELRGEMAELRGEMAGLRAEIRGLTPRLALASLGTSGALFGLVAAAVAVFG